MAVDLTTLVPEFRTQVEAVIVKCAERGIEMRPHGVLRTPIEQAKLWRQSRAIEEILDEIANLRTQGADFLADCLESVGPQHGKHVTNAIPGKSWHQWGEAADCFWVLNGKAEWSPTKKVNGLKWLPCVRRGGGITWVDGWWKVVRLQRLAACAAAQRQQCDERNVDPRNQRCHEGALWLNHAWGPYGFALVPSLS